MAFTLTHEGESTEALETVLANSIGWFVEIDYNENGVTPVHVEGFVLDFVPSTPSQVAVTVIAETVNGKPETRTGRELRIILHEVSDLNIP